MNRTRDIREEDDGMYFYGEEGRIAAVVPNEEWEHLSVVFVTCPKFPAKVHVRLDDKTEFIGTDFYSLKKGQKVILDVVLRADSAPVALNLRLGSKRALKKNASHVASGADSEVIEASF